MTASTRCFCSATVSSLIRTLVFRSFATQHRPPRSDMTDNTTSSATIRSPASVVTKDTVMGTQPCPYHTESFLAANVDDSSILNPYTARDAPTTDLEANDELDTPSCLSRLCASLDRIINCPSTRERATDIEAWNKRQDASNGVASCTLIPNCLQDRSATFWFGSAAVSTVVVVIVVPVTVGRIQG